MSFSEYVPRSSNDYTVKYDIMEFDLICDILDDLKIYLEGLNIMDFFIPGKKQESINSLYGMFHSRMKDRFKGMSKDNFKIEPRVVPTPDQGNIKFVIINLNSKFLITLTDIVLDEPEQPDIKIRFTFYPLSGNTIYPLIWLNYIGNYDIEFEFI